MLVTNQRNSWSVAIEKDGPDARAGSESLHFSDCWELGRDKFRLYRFVSCSFPKHPLLATLGDRLLGWGDTSSEFLFCS